MTSIENPEDDLLESADNPYPLETEGDLVRAAEAGSPQAQYMLGLTYATGRNGFAKDSSKAVELWMKAAEGGEPGAMLACAQELRLGDNLPVDLERARFWCDRLLALPSPYDPSRALMEKGNIMNDLGDFAGAAQCWGEAAMAYGLARALSPYGICLYKGIGIEKDEEKGVEILNQYVRDLATNRRDATEVMNEIFGLSISFPMTGEEDQRRIALCREFRHERLVLSAKRGDARAQGILGDEYERGEFNDHPDSRKHAVHWLNKRAETGDAKALLRLYHIYMGKDDDAQDAAQAFDCLRRASLLREILWGAVSHHTSAIDFDYAAYTMQWLVQWEQARLSVL